jgi:hypothetical protein
VSPKLAVTVMGDTRRDELVQEMRDQFKSWYQEKCWEGDSIEDPSHDHK